MVQDAFYFHGATVRIAWIFLAHISSSCKYVCVWTHLVDTNVLLHLQIVGGWPQIPPNKKSPTGQFSIPTFTQVCRGLKESSIASMISYLLKHQALRSLGLNPPNAKDWRQYLNQEGPGQTRRRFRVSWTLHIEFLYTRVVVNFAHGMPTGTQGNTLKWSCL